MIELSFTAEDAERAEYAEVVEVRLQALRDTLNKSIAEGGAHTDEELDRALDETGVELVREGY